MKFSFVQFSKKTGINIGKLLVHGDWKLSVIMLTIFWPKCLQDDPEIVPRRSEAMPKMAPRWPRDGSENVLGRCKWEPRNPQIAKTAKIEPQKSRKTNVCSAHDVPPYPTVFSRDIVEKLPFGQVVIHITN